MELSIYLHNLHPFSLDNLACSQSARQKAVVGSRPVLYTASSMQYFSTKKCNSTVAAAVGVQALLVLPKLSSDTQNAQAKEWEKKFKKKTHTHNNNNNNSVLHHVLGRSKTSRVSLPSEPTTPSSFLQSQKFFFRVPDERKKKKKKKRQEKPGAQ